MNLDDEEAVGLGWVELIRAAMRKAARQLGWKATTTGWIGTRHGTVIASRTRGTSQRSTGTSGYTIHIDTI